MFKRKVDPLLRFILILPGSTDLDAKGRIKGSLDIPLNHSGAEQVQKTAEELDRVRIDIIYSAPCLSAQQTAEQLSRGGEIKIKIHEELRNLDRGLWHGKLIDELKDSQPKVYRQWQERPESVRPPGGETLDEVRLRLSKLIKKIQRKHKSGTVAIVVPEPAASVLRSQLDKREIGDLWKAECRSGEWQSIEVASDLSL